jgi:hypothetical protein
MAVNIEDHLPVVKFNGLNTAKDAAFTGALAVTGAITATGGVVGAVTGAVTGNVTGLITSSGTVPTSYATGSIPFSATTAATQTQIVTTATYLAEVFIPAAVTLTGVSILNGHTTNASANLTVGLANAAGTVLVKSATTVAQSTADAYQQVPFTATYGATGPAKYYVLVQGSTTTGYLATHTIGNFGAKSVTSETYGTFLTTASYSTTSFTTALGPVASTY